MKKLILLVIYILFSLLASGCNSVPFRLDALEAEREAARIQMGAAQTDEDVEAANKRFKKAEKRISRYEQWAVDAEEFYLNRAACLRSESFTWLCQGNEKYSDKNPPKDLDALVRAYRNDKMVCGCGDTQEILRALERAGF